MKALFKDLLVIDCASFVAGPAAGTMLSDFGARVIKIEPLGGDGYRMLKHLPGLPGSDSNYPWSLTNRNKESLALDLKQSEGRAILDTLIARADVFIINYPLGVRDRLKLRYEDIAGINPRLIYASLTPYGEEGPEAGSTGYDATAWWARSGLMDAVRASGDTPPAVSVPAMGDHMAACSLYGAIVTALYRRQSTGEGAMVGTSLLANGLWSNGIMVQAALDGANTSTRLDRDQLSAFTQIYRCRDDRWFILTILPQVQERMWPALAKCVGHEEWLDDTRFASVEDRHRHNVELTGLLAQAFQQQDWDDWNPRFLEFGVTCGRIARCDDHGEDEQVQAAGLLRQWDDGSDGRTLDSPLYVSGALKRTPRPAPTVGQHTSSILTEFGLDAQDIERLKSSGAIGVS
jgi:crotonobetainyl-CoA:carnitine CoA-transferase CaiB-like acyl-CoA transferase